MILSDIKLKVVVLNALIVSYCCCDCLLHKAQSSSTARRSISSSKMILIRIAIFVDLPLVNHLEENLNLRSANLKGIFLHAYVGQMDSLFERLTSESISRINLELVRIEYEQEIGQFSGNSSTNSIDLILGSFCLYQESKREDDDWDFALLLTARDLLDEDESTPEEATSLLGMSPISGIQWPDLSCAAVELGTGFQNSYLETWHPTRGLASAWVAAHELGHNLGLHHDGAPFNEDCDGGQFLMAKYSLELSASSSRHYWSSCSSMELDTLDLSRFKLKGPHSPVYEKKILPGRVLDADLQCKIFGKHFRFSMQADKLDCTGPLVCLTPTNKSVPIGPALDGTRCFGSSDTGDLHCCIAGSCVNMRVPAAAAQ